MFTVILLGFHAIYLLICCFWSFWNDGPLTTALEEVFLGYVLSALLVSIYFVLGLALYKVWVKDPDAEFQTSGFITYWVGVWVGCVWDAIVETKLYTLLLYYIKRVL